MMNKSPICLLLMLLALPVQAANIGMNNTDLSAAIELLGKRIHKTFLIDPRVKGKVNIIGLAEVPDKDVYGVLLSILQIHGYAAVEEGSLIKIVPNANAKQMAMPLANNKHPGNGDEIVTRVLELNNVSASVLVPILRPLVPQAGHLAAYPPSNMLIIADTASNIQRLSNIVHRVDTPSNDEVEMITLSYASAKEVVQILNTLAQRAKTSAQSQHPTLVADERTNSILIGGSKPGRLRLKTMISYLDSPLEHEGDIHVVYLRYANAKDLVPVLTGIKKGIIAEQKNTRAKTPQARQANAINIQADESINALVINASQETYQSLLAVIRKLDVRRAQVLVEAIIAEISEDESAELGVQWVIDSTPGGRGPIGISNLGSPGISDIAAAAASKTLTTIPSGLTLGIGRFNSNNINFGALLRALRSKSGTNILSTPSLLTLDNKEAQIVIGQNVPFITGSFSSTGSSNNPSNPFQTINREDVGLTLKVKPQINEGNTLMLDIEQEVSSLNPAVQSNAGFITNKRSIKTSVLVEDGQTIILGGLIQNDLKETEQKVPLLGDIPIIGTLFRHKKTTKTKTNLMVFLRPVIIRNADVSKELTSGKYNFIRAQQIDMQQRGVPLMPEANAPLGRSLQDYQQEYKRLQQLNATPVAKTKEPAEVSEDWLESEPL